MIRRGGFAEKLFFKLKYRTEHLNYGREIVTHWAIEYASGLNSNDIKLLDIGLGTGTDLLNIKSNLSDRNVHMFGIETYGPNVEKARQKNGITVFSMNIETESIPVGDEYFDVVVANQIIEHTKEIFWIFGEMHRVLKVGG